jgi:hypothetical protein
MKYQLEIDDAIVLLLGAPVPGVQDGEIKGITRLEKLVFLLERETKSGEWLSQKAEFEPYHFGPFSEKVYQAIDMLAAAEIIDDSYSVAADDIDTWELREGIGLENGSGSRDPFTTRNFRLTDRGKRYFKALEQEIPPESLREIILLKKNFAFLPLRQLIRYVYQRYEAFTTKSVIRDDILGKS